MSSWYILLLHARAGQATAVTIQELERQHVFLSAIRRGRAFCLCDILIYYCTCSQHVVDFQYSSKPMHSGNMKRAKVQKHGILVAKLLISLASWCIVFPVVLVVTIVNELVRLVVLLLFKLKHKGTFSLVRHGADNFWHCKVQGNSRMCLLLGVTQDKVDIHKYIKRFEEQVLGRVEPDGETKTYNKLKKTFVKKFGYYCLRDDSQSFNILNHIKVYDGCKPANGRDYFTDEEFFHTIIPKLSEDMDESKPQWENVLIPRVRFRDEETLSNVICNRWHHSLMDGISVMTMNRYCMRDKDRLEELEKSSEFNPLVSLPMLKHERILAKSFAFLLAPYLTLEVFLRSCRLNSRFYIKSYSGQRLYGWSERIDYNLIREIKGNAGAKHVTAVLATALASAFSKLIENSPRDEDSERVLPLALMNAMLPYKNLKPRNRETATQLTLPMGKMHWRERMGRINQQIQKKDPAFFAFFYFLRWMGRLPWWVIELAFSTGVGGGVQHMSFCNVPVGMKEWHVVGSRFTDAAGWAMLYMNNGFAAQTFRFGDNLRYCAVVDDSCMSQEELDFCLKQVIVEIRDMVYYCRQKSFVLIAK